MPEAGHRAVTADNIDYLCEVKTTKKKATLPHCRQLTLRLNKGDNLPNKAVLNIRRTLSEKATGVLYIHGFNDYFFQEHLASWFNEHGIHFYGLDLRRHGRSIMKHQRPNLTHDLTEYDEDIDQAVDHMIHEEGLTDLWLMAHSTGGLIAATYCHRRKQELPFRALILNSPFFTFNVSTPEKWVLPLLAWLGSKRPDIPMPTITPGYGMSLHTSHHGRWNYDLQFKPVHGHAIDMGWISTVFRHQQQLKKGLNLDIPILLMYSDLRVKPGPYRREMQYGDAMLNPADMKRNARHLGKDVRQVCIKGGVHDLFLSEEEAQREAFMALEDFINSLQS